MPEVFSSAETSLELVNPITDAVIMAIPFLRDDSFSESPNYGPRGYHRSAAVSAARLRSKGTITIRKDAESMAFAREVERWQKGVIWYPMGSDLKGKRFRHPHIRKVMTQPDGTKEYRTAYDVRLSDRTLSRPDAGLVSESFTFEVQGGFDSPDSDRGESVRALDFLRTGPATYLSPDGTLRTAGDGVARFGLPGPVVRRNLFSHSENVGNWSLDGSRSYVETLGPDGKTMVTATKLSSGHVWTGFGKSPGKRVVSVYARAVSGSASVRVTIDTINPSIGNTFKDTALSAESWTRIDLSNDSGATSVEWWPNIWRLSGEVLICWVQFERGPLTPYQPTNTTGVDVTHPLNGAGLVLEGATRNCLVSTNFSTWSTYITNGATGEMSVVSSPEWGSVLKLKSTNKVAGGRYGKSGGVSGASGRSMTQSAYFKIASTDATARLSFYVDYGNSAGGLIAASRYFTLKDFPVGLWLPLAYAIEAPLSGGFDGSGLCYFWLEEGLADIEIAYPQCETGMLRTSFTPGQTTRQPDLCGIVPPHNELLHSRDLTQGAWVNNGLAVVKSATSNTITLTGGKSLVQTLTPASIPGTARTLAIKVRKGTSNDGNFAIIVQNQSGADIASRTILTSDLSASEARTFYVTATPGATVTGLKAMLYVVSGSGTVIVESLRLVRGSHPGIEVQTGDTPIYAPPSPALDPAWSQNGTIEWEGVYPTTGHYYLIGYNDLAFRVYRDAIDGMVWIDRGHNGASGSYGVPGRGAIGSATNITDGSRHRFRYTWTNEINDQSGVREMWQRLYIDGVLVAQQDVAALYGATAWAPIDPSRLISDGNVNAVISGPSSNPGGVIIEFPRPRAGYRQVDRAA